jgi:hypothetical protein
MGRRSSAATSVTSIVVSAVAFAAASASPAAAAARAFALTHSITTKVTIVDEWTRTPEPGCSVQGSGSVKATLAWARPARARPLISPGAGRWVLLVPGTIGSAVLDLRAQPTTGTIAYVDNTTDVGECELPRDRSGCGTYKLGGRANVYGLDRRSLTVETSLRVGSQLETRRCQVGIYVGLNDRHFFRRPLTLTMPSVATLARRSRVPLHTSRTGHIHLPTNHAILDETVTETVDVTLTRLHR